MIDSHANYTPAEVGGHLRLEAETIQSWCREGKFPNAFKTSDDAFGHWLIPGQDILDFIEVRRAARKERGAA